MGAVHLYVLLLVTVFLHNGHSGSLDDEPLNFNPNTPKSRGSKFFLGFMNNQNLSSLDTTSDIALFVTTEEVSSNFTVCTRFAGVSGVEGFAETPAGSGLFCNKTSAERGKFTVIEFPSGRLDLMTNGVAPDIAVQDNVDRNKGVHVSASDPSHELTIYGLNDELASTDGYMAISCTTFPTARDYRYVVFSAGFVVEGSFRLSRFLIVPCDDDTHISITGSQPIQSPSDMNPSVTQTDPSGINPAQRTVMYGRALNQYETLMIDSRSDLTGTIIISDKPISVFTGHQCGQVPAREPTCDYLVEQIPPHATYGTVFFTAPFAARESGDIYRIASIREGVKGSVTCSQEGSTDSTTSTFEVNQGNLANTAEIRTKSGSKREFCCIQTDRPVSVMGYTLAHELDFITIEGRPAPYGDPAMVYIAPAASYLNDYTITTSKRLDRTIFFGYISYILPIRVFDNSKQDQDNFRVNGAIKTPDSGYQPIYCPVDGKNEICAYGAYTEVGQGEFTIQYGTVNEAFGLYTYGFLAEQLYAYTGAIEMKSVGLAWIQGVDLVVLETAGTVTLLFRRFAGDVVLRSRAFARTRDVPLGQALAGSDYTANDPAPGANSNLRWRANRPDPNREFTVVILDDNVPEPVEYLEVVLTCDGNENCYIPQSVYRITIIDTQGQCVDLPPITGGGIDYDFEQLPMRPFGTTATYNCTMGTLVGPTTRTCDNGEWTGTPPSCTTEPVGGLCPALPEFTNGEISYDMGGPNEFPDTTVATYSCNTGYVLEGEPDRICNVPEDTTPGEFGGVVPSCVPVCMELEAIENGMISYSVDNVGPEYDLGTVATYSCDPGFQLNTESEDEMRTCTDGGDGVGGVFIGVAPTCDPILCPMLPGIDNGFITYSPDTVADFDQGTVATYTCNQGFNLQGERERMCQIDGTFSGTAPICTTIPVCMDLPVLVNGLITYNIEETPRPLGTVATYECNPGFVLAGQENRTCVEDSGVGVFNGVKPVCDRILCQELASLVNGEISYAPDTEQPFEIDTFAFHECNPGFALVGTETRTCVEDDPELVVGIFTESPPTCEPIVCDLLPEIENGKFSYLPLPGDEDLTVGLGSVATYSCFRGYRLIGTEMRTCEDVGAGITGEFSDTEPSCEQITCTDLPEITNGVITYNMPAPRPVDTTATYVCEEGFTLIGNSVRNCQEDETFSGEDPFCSMIPVCPDLQPLVNGMITYSESDVPRPIGTVADHVCINGYVLVGEKIRTCEDDDGVGRFNGDAPTCEPVCDELQAIDNGMISYAPDTTAVFVGTVATYSCNEGYQLISGPGGDTRTCVDGGDGNGGVFNGVSPTCEPVCDELSALENGRIEYAPDSTGPKYNLNTVATYICDGGFELNTETGDETRTCIDGGDGNGVVFDGQKPSCQPIPGDETICTITEPLMVSPFTLSSRYTFMGTCEHILLQSCPPEIADFVVVADFITDSMENGAIGIFIVSTETYFVSSEGGAFRDNAGDFEVIAGDVSGDHVRFYSEASVTVTLRPSEDYNEISVGGGVGVTVRHDYGDTAAFTVSVSSGSSISETCGLCGTQEGQLQFRDGTFANITDRVQIEAFTRSYLVPARDQALRPQRRECVIVIGLTETVISVGEEEEVVEVCAEVISGELERSVLFSLTSADETAIAGNDYGALSAIDLEFTSSIDQVCVNVSITPDDIYENAETFIVTVTSVDTQVVVQPDRETGTVTIVDEDGIIIGFEQIRYSVQEISPSVEVCATILSGNLALERDAIVNFFTEDGTEVVENDAVAPDDYEETIRELVFDADNSRLCVSIPIVCDGAVEGIEAFWANLRTDAPRVTLDPAVAVIDIIDKGGVFVGYVGTPYIFPEEGEIVTIVVVTGNLHEEVLVNLRSEDISGIDNAAVAGVDYIPIDVSLTFGADVRQKSINVTLINDGFDELDELFNVRIMIMTSANVFINMPLESVTILDEDGITIGLEVTSQDITEVEGVGTREVCAFITGGTLRRTAIVNLVHSQGTALVDEDFEAVAAVLEFDADTNRACATITIEDDTRHETTEEVFELVLTTDDPDITLGPSTTTFTILDDDDVVIGWEVTGYTVAEGVDQTAELCAAISRQLTFELSAIISTRDGTATSTPNAGVLQDYISVSSPSSFFFSDTSAGRMCTTIPISDNQVIEETIENFFVDLTLTSAVDRVSIEPATAEVSILDNDAATIGFIETAYTFDEDVGDGRLIIGVLAGTLETDIVVQITTSDGSTVSTANGDYTGVTNTLTFSGSSSVRTQAVAINDDNIDEEDLENFLANLVLVTDNNRVTIAPSDATVYIRDNDVVMIGFEREIYISTENNTIPTEVCASVTDDSPTLDREVEVEITSSDGSAEAPDDYESVSEMFTFGPGSTRQCVGITVQEDGVVEGEEDFILTLNSTDDVVLVPDTATVVIEDFDEIVRVMFREPEYTFTENGIIGRVEVFKDGASDSPFQVRVFGGPSVQTDIERSADRIDEVQTFEAGLSADNSLFFEFALTDDSVGLEAIERYFADLIIVGTPGGVMLGSVTTVRVNVLDNDVVSVSFGTPQVTVIESNEFFMMCVITNRDFLQDVVVQLESVDGTAVADNDYIESSIPSSITISAGQSRTCFNGTIVDDLAQEDTESFTLNIVGAGPGGVVVDQGTTEIVIEEQPQCPVGSYEEDVSTGESACVPCPTNSFSTMAGSTECTCFEGYFRTVLEEPNYPCTSPPSACRQLQIVSEKTRATTITVRWDRPEIIGREDFYYNIFYSEDNQTFIQHNPRPYIKQDAVVDYALSGLKALTMYTIRVSVENGVSDQDERRDGNFRSCETIGSTGDSRANAPSLVLGQCTIVVWTAPTRTYGRIIGYDVNFVLPGSEEDVMISKGSRELFHVIGDEIAPSNEMSTLVQVRAKTSSANGRWSELVPLGCAERPTCPP